MSESATLLLSYYNIQELSDDASDIDNIQSINDILNSVRPITCDNPYDINLKGLIFQLSGKKVRNYDIKRASDLIKESITHFQNAIELRKTQFSVISIPEIYLNLGNARNMLYHPDQKEKAMEEAHKAESDYNNAIESKNIDIINKAYIGLSYVNYILENYDKGIENATKAINHFKGKQFNSNDLASVYNNRGLIYAALGKDNYSNIQNASNDFNEALKAAPQFFEARYNLENLYSNSINEKILNNKFEEVEKDISDISNKKIKLILLHNLANGYFEADNTDKAIEILRDNLALKPINSATTILFCSILHSRGEFEDEAFNNLTSISSDDPFYASAQNLIGCIYYSQGEYKKSIEYLNNAITYETDHSKKKSFQKNLAISYLENGEMVKGKNILSQENI